MPNVVSSITAEYRRYKTLGEAAIAQLSDAELARSSVGDSNSIVVIVRHIAGNLRSRFTDFRVTDGEKQWRNRDEEFEERALTRDEVMAAWESGWEILFAALNALTDEDLHQTVTIRGHSLSIHEALHRSLAHTSYHVGQIVYVAKSMHSADWQSLSIPRGQSAAFNRNPR